jgi:hypothetical protein
VIIRITIEASAPRCAAKAIGDVSFGIEMAVDRYIAVAWRTARDSIVIAMRRYGNGGRAILGRPTAGRYQRHERPRFAETVIYLVKHITRLQSV